MANARMPQFYRRDMAMGELAHWFKLWFIALFLPGEATGDAW